MKRIFLFFFLMILFGQFASEDAVIATIRNKTAQYLQRYDRAKLMLRFNQPLYAPGDTVYFSMSYLRAADLKPVPKRQLVHVILFDQQGKRQLVHWATVVDGYGSGKLAIPETFPPGGYLLVAFTDWMKNFDASLFYQKKIVIAGRYKIRKSYPTDSLSIHAEGGAIVADLENNLLISYRGAAPRAVVNIRQNQQIIRSLNIARDSMKTVSFVPVAGQSYQAEIESVGDNKKFSLPPILPAGITMRADFSIMQSKILLHVSRARSTATYYACVFNNTGLLLAQPVNFVEQAAEVILPQSLPKGVLQIAIFDVNLNLAVRRVIYLPVAEQMIKVNGLHDQYKTRGSIDLQFDFGGSPAPDVSCRIINTDLLGAERADQVDYLNFQSDIASNLLIETRGRTVQAINEELIAQTCPWFNWDRIKTSENHTPLVVAQEHLSITGRAINPENLRPARDSTLLMFFLEKSLLGYETYTRRGGKFTFPLYYSSNFPDRFFYAASYLGDDVEEIHIQLDDPDSLVHFYAEPWQSEEEKPDPYATFSMQQKTINRSFTFFSGINSAEDTVANPNALFEEELNGWDFNVTLNDFLQMPTMEDVIREILKAVEYRHMKGRHVVRVYTTGKIPTNRTGPLYIMDGMLTKDPSYFISLKPRDVISIKVYRNSKKLFALGKLGQNGVIMVRTKQRQPQMHESHVIDFPGFLPAGRELSRKFAKGSAPDLRSCLLWSARVNGEHVQINVPDDVGNFVVQIVGQSNDGLPIFSEWPFQVKFSKN